MIKKYFGQSEEWEGDFFASTSELKRMSDYAGLGMLKLPELPWSLFLLIKRDSWIQKVKEAPDGGEILKTIWRLKQTKADLNKVRKFQERRE